MLTTDFIYKVFLMSIYAKCSFTFNAVKTILESHSDEINTMILAGYNNGSIYDYCLGIVLDYKVKEGDEVYIDKVLIRNMGIKIKNYDRFEYIRFKIEAVLGDFVQIKGKLIDVSLLSF